VTRKTIHLRLGDALLDACKSNKVRPLNRAFHNALRYWSSRRLYRFLGYKFFQVARAGGSEYNISYRSLCELLGVKAHKYESKAYNQLQRFHEELVEHQFLSSEPGWEPSKTREKDWTIIYWPGSRAKAEMTKGYWRTKKHMTMVGGVDKGKCHG